jgi:hypothetical protein
VKNRFSNIFTAIILLAIVLFLAVDAGYFLYDSDRFTTLSPFGVLDIIRGDILVMKKDSLTWEKAADGMILEQGVRIKTAPDAQAVINFTKGTTTKLEPGTDLVIDKIEQSQDTQAYAVVLKQQSGKTWNQVDKSGGNTDFQIRTESADILVHGTLFAAEVDETGKTTVQTTEGRVSVSAGGTEVPVTAGKMTQVQPNEKPSAPVSIPQPKNELVITVNRSAYSLVKDPSGSSAGYLNSGAKVNQISGASISVAEQSGQTIRIREPEIGDYMLALRGTTESIGQVSVEGLINGKSAFVRVESCNITSAKDTLLRLHYDVIDGLLQLNETSDTALVENNVAMASTVIDTSAKIKPTKTPAAPVTTDAKTTTPVKQATSWFGFDNYGQIGRLVSIMSFLFLIGIIFVIMRHKS